MKLKEPIYSFMCYWIEFVLRSLRNITWTRIIGRPLYIKTFIRPFLVFIKLMKLLINIRKTITLLY